MSRIPFWLVVLFALILCVAGAVTLLHRTGLLETASNPQVAADTALTDVSGLVLTGAERRTAGLALSGRAAPQAKLSLIRGNEILTTATADAEGDFMLVTRLDDAKGWLPLQVMAEGRPPVPLAINMTHRAEGKIVAGAMQKQPDGSWTAVTLPATLAIAAISELPDGSWHITGQQPDTDKTKDRKLLVQLYSDDNLIATAKPAGDAFALTLPKAALPQRDLRVDIYDAASLQPIIRLNAALPLDKSFFRIAADVTGQPAPVWIWQDAAAQQADLAEPRPGQIIPVAPAPAPAAK